MGKRTYRGGKDCYVFEQITYSLFHLLKYFFSFCFFSFVFSFLSFLFFSFQFFLLFFFLFFSFFFVSFLFFSNFFSSLFLFSPTTHTFKLDSPVVIFRVCHILPHSANPKNVREDPHQIYLLLRLFLKIGYLFNFVTMFQITNYSRVNVQANSSSCMRTNLESDPS